MSMREFQFSKAGEKPTEFERALLVAPRPAARQNEDLIAFAQRHGVEALVLFMDEFGGEKIHIPKRAEFFQSLAQSVRNERIVELRHAGKTAAEIASMVGVSEIRVRAILAESAREVT
jgi:hypothetical protein